ncbi:MAG: hypothetical protein VX223_10610 [Myxococcota bacterium]|nr:hypothetical protein [Myxococcota bacterium]
MRRSIIVVLALLTLASPASAKDMNGKFGVGYTQTIGGVGGFSFRYWATRSIGLELDFGLSFVNSDGDRSTTEFVAAVGLFYALVQHRSTNLLIGVRGDIGFRSQPAASTPVLVADGIDNQSASTTSEASGGILQFNLEFPLMVEYFFTDTFAINLTVGIVLIFVPDGGTTVLNTLGPGTVAATDTFAVGIGAGGLLGSAGFTFYF